VAVAVRLLQSARPLIGLLLGFCLRDSVSFLNPPNQLILLAGNRLPVIVGELSSALAGRSRKLFPLAFDLIPIHVVLP